MAKKLLALAAFLAAGEPAFSWERLQENGAPAWAARAVLGAGYIAGAAYASHYWWNSGVGKNPLANIGEDEPYVEDKLWHLWNGENLTDFHHWTLSRGWGQRSPWPAMGLSFLVLTSIELFDASNRDGFWKLSVLDEAAGAAGIMLWYAKHRWPDRIPLEVRVGIRQWGRAGELFDRLAHFPRDRADQAFSHMDDYAMLKTEVIVRPRGYLYFGGAVSLKSDQKGRGLEENLYGATVGFDLTRYLANRNPDSWTRVLNIFGRYFATSVDYTYWFE